MAQAVAMVALALIAFAGGLDAEWGNARPVFGRAVVVANFVGDHVLLVAD
jgi:hypothetical protein